MTRDELLKAKEVLDERQRRVVRKLCTLGEIKAYERPLNDPELLNKQILEEEEKALTVALSCMELCEELEPADEEISDLKAKNEGLIDCLSTRDYAIADLKKILETPDKWMKWCDIRVLERCEGLEKEIAKLHTYGDCYKADYHDMKDERDGLRKEIADLKLALTKEREF